MVVVLWSPGLEPGNAAEATPSGRRQPERRSVSISETDTADRLSTESPGKGGGGENWAEGWPNDRRNGSVDSSESMENAED